MAAALEVQEILDGSVPDGSVPVSADEGSRTVTLAAEEINRLLNAALTNLLLPHYREIHIEEITSSGV